MRQTNYGLVLDIIKNREGRVGDKLLYSWDIDIGNFSYIPSPDDAARAQTRQQFTQQDKQQFVTATASAYREATCRSEMSYAMTTEAIAATSRSMSAAVR